MSVATAESEPQVRLRNVDWQTYIALRDEHENRNIRMTYDHGLLELMSPSKLHERLGTLIGRLIEVWTEEHGIPLQSCRTMSLRREDLRRGLEPDNCYYLAHEFLVRERDELDLEVDPPPDLAIEIDVASSSLHKLPIYAVLRVPEVWRFDGESLQILQLDDRGEYIESDESEQLPGLPPAKIVEFLERRHECDETQWVRQFRQWVRERSSDDRLPP